MRGEPEPIRHPVKFYEKGDAPLEIVTTRQWYIRNGSRDEALRARLLDRGRELAWHPAHMRSRFEHWVDGPDRRLADQPPAVLRRAGPGVVPGGRPRPAGPRQPILPADADLPVDPAADAAPGYQPAQRDRARRVRRRPGRAWTPGPPRR